MTGFNHALAQLTMPLAQALTTRASVRSYSGDAIPKETVRTLLAAAVRAPTAIHQEAWRFAVVQDRMLLRQISDFAKPMFIDEMHRAHRDGGGGAPLFADPSFDIFHGAGTLIVICAPAQAPFSAADCWLAAQNLMLAACAMGLGTCVIGSAVTTLNLPQWRAELGIPEGMAAFAPIAVGMPAGPVVATGRKEAVVLRWR